MRSLSRALFTLLLAAPLAFTGCKQGEGDRCQVDKDCGEGLRCCYQVSNPSSQELIEAGGVCTPDDKCRPTVVPDGNIDGPAPDIVSDNEASTPDTRTPDQNSPDQSSPDQSSPDQSSPDQSSPDQSSPDQNAADQNAADQSTPDTGTSDTLSAE